MKRTFAVQAFIKFALLVVVMIGALRMTTQRARRNWIVLTAFFCGASVIPGGTAWGAGGDLLWEVATGGVLAASNGRVVVAGLTGVQTFDGNSGTPLWQDSFSGARTVVIDGQQVIVVGANAIRAYKARNGSLHWQGPLAPGTVIDAAEMKGDQLLVAGTATDATGAVQLIVRAYDARNGQIDWEYQSLPPNTRLATGYGHRQKSLSIHGTRAYVVATVWILGQDSHPLVSCLVRAYDRNGGGLVWESISNERCAANAVAANHKQVILAGIGGAAVDDFLVRSYDAQTGELLWQNRTFVGTAFDNQAAAVDDEGKRAFVAGWVAWLPGTGEAFLVRAYNMKTGELDWEDRYPGSVVNCLCQAHDIVAQSGRVLAVGGGLGGGGQVSIVRAYDARSGNLVWQNELPTDGFQANNLAEWVAVDRGLVFAVDTRVLRAYDAK